MEDPANEVANVAALVTAAINPEVQKAAVLKYYAPDMTFRHPFCTVAPGENSRDAMLSILQWYRIMSPVISIRASEVVYDEEKKSAFLDVTQTFHIRWSPLNPAPARLIVLLKLRPVPSPTDPSKTVYLIASQEDFYHPEDLAALLVPPLAPLVRILHRAATLSCRVYARAFNMLGYWVVHDGEGGKGVELEPRGEPLPPAGDDEAEELEEEEGGDEQEEGSARVPKVKKRKRANKKQD